MLPSASVELARALEECLARSAGAYVCLRTGQRWRRLVRRLVPEYRVNVRTRAGEEYTCTGATAVVALQAAAARLRVANKE
jgi:hypothetical protein